MKAIGSFFKNFVVYNHDMDIDRDVMQHEVPALTDPNGQTWSTVGLVPVTDEGFIFHSLDGMGLLFCVQFNERILPAKVRDEHFRKTLDAIEQREGRKPTKKEYAELRDEAERDLLPKAFIKRAKVFGLLTNSRLLIFTGSSKRQDDVLLIINHYLNDVGIDNTSIRRPSLKEAVSGMTSLALEEDDWLSATDHGVLRIEGDHVYGALKFESGGHRVQRVPATETQGRIHTSACTVAVMPEPDEHQAITLNPADLRIDTFRASGAGGQHINKTDSAVRVVHLPTGIVAECQDGRSQHSNKAKALQVLQARIQEKERSERAAKEAALRKGLIGSGDRSDRIRTYNFPQGRLTDHRINLTLYKLLAVMEGDLGDVLQALQHAREAEQLEELEKGAGV